MGKFKVILLLGHKVNLLLCTYKKQLLSLISRVVNVLVSFTFTWLVAKFLSINEAGCFFLFLTLLSIFSIVSARGYEYILVKYIAKSREFSAHIIRYILINSILVSSFMSIALLLIYYLLKQFELHGIALLDPLFYTSIGLIFFTSQYLSGFIFQSRDMFFLNTLSQRLLCNFFFILILVLLYLIKVELSLLLVMIVFFISLLLSVALLYYYVYKKFIKNEVFSALELNLVSNIKSDSSALFKMQLFQVFSVYFGVIAISFFGSSAEIAALSISQRISAVLAFFVLATTNTIAGKIALHYSNGDLISVKSLYVKSVRFSAFFGGTLGILLIYFSQDILIFFGEDYLTYTSVYIILVCSQIVNSITGPSDVVLMLCNGEVEHKNNVRISSIISMLSIVLLIIPYGVIGCAVSIFLASTLTNILDFISLYRKVNKT